MKDGPRILKRKRVIGDSYLFKFQSLADYLSASYGHSDEGYRQVGFRYVKEKVDVTKRKNKFGEYVSSMDMEFLKIWRLK